MDNLVFTYNSIKDWIMNADRKANIFIVVNLFVIGFVLEQEILFQSNEKTIMMLLGLLFIGCAMFSMFFLLKVVTPRLNNDQGGSRIFFQDIANSKNQVDIVQEIQMQSNSNFRHDLATQIRHISNVCKRKHRDLIFSIGFMVPEIIVTVVLKLL